MPRTSFARRLLVAGAALWFVRWLGSPQPVQKTEAVAPPEPVRVRDDWEFPHPALAPKRRRRRMATSLVFTTLFFAGAALAAGAGNQFAHVSEDSTVAAVTDATTTDTTATDAAVTPDATTAEDAVPAAAPAETEAAPADPAPVDAAPADAATPDAPAPADVAPATSAPDPSDVTLKPAAPAVASPASASAPATVSKPRVAQRRSTHRKLTHRAHPQNLPLLIPYHAIAFDPQSWLNDNPGTPTGQAAVAIAMNYLGVPYRWGGAVPATGFDCSGLTRFVYAQLGVSLPHYAAYQFASFTKLDPTQLQPGDLVFFEPKFDGPGHVGLYIGHDQMIEAPHTGALVRVNSVSAEAAKIGFLGAVRPYSGATPSLALVSSVEWGPAPSSIRLQ
jgi:cell wall-associated NlpC family hydrolase